MDVISSRSSAQERRIVIVGAGFAGLGTAVRLKQAGINDFLILEKAAEVGGTWEANTYPGCQCDVPSHLYSFSFAPNPSWTRTFSTQPEIWAYLQRVADEHGLYEHIELGVTVERAEWDEQRQLWRLQTSAGSFTAQILISGMGGLSEPSIPDIEGLDSFEGSAFHSARWEHSVALADRKVAVIGTGASAIQIVPKIQPEVAQLHLFQRTPPWVMPHSDRPLSDLEHRLYRRFPITQRLMREGIYWGRELYVLPFMHQALARPGEQIALRHLRSQVSDPSLQEKLTPTYRMGCKRILLSNDFYPAVQQPNVTLQTAAIERVQANSVKTCDGAEHEVEVIVLCTGFHVTDMPFANWVFGRQGRSLADVWEGSPHAHLGITVNGFPNLFMLLGPHTGLGHTSVVFMIECQIEYLVRCLQTMAGSGLRSIEPKRAAEARFVAEMESRLQGTVWTSGGCNSWYLDSRGRASSLWPGPTWRYRRRLRRFEPSEYIMRPQTLAGRPEPATTQPLPSIA